MTFKDTMVELTNKTKKIKLDKKQKDNKKEIGMVQKESEQCANRIIKDIPKRIKDAAIKGESSIYEWCYSGDNHGRGALVLISEWAKEQGFETKFERNCEGANEGQSPMDYLTVSWENFVEKNE